MVVPISGTVTAQQGGSSNPWTTNLKSINGTIISDSSVPVKGVSATRADTYTVPADGVTVNVSTKPVKCHAIQVKGTGAVADAWDVRLEGSLDNVNFTQILQHINGTNTDGEVVFSGAALAPSLYFRSRVETITLGSATNVVVTVLGTE